MRTAVVAAQCGHVIHLFMQLFRMSLAWYALGLRRLQLLH